MLFFKIPGGEDVSIGDNPNRRLSHAGVAAEDFARDTGPSSPGRQAVRSFDGVLYAILAMVAGANSYRQMGDHEEVWGGD